MTTLSKRAKVFNRPVVSMVGKLYTIDCGAYGKFLVTKEQYDNVQVGDDIPSYLKDK